VGQAFSLPDFCHRLLAAILLAVAVAPPAAAADIAIMTYDPGHFHAGLLMKEMTPGVSRQTYIYAPLGPDLTAHLGRVIRFNTRAENPTSWDVRVYAGADPFQKMLAEHPGNVVVFSGRNQGKIDRIRASIDAGLHVLADKPWLIETEEFPRLAPALFAARKRGVAVYDAMTQRFEVSCILQKDLVNDREVYGRPVSVYMESVHYLLKTVAGAVNQRPPWFFDIRQQGEGLTDVGTHLVDLVQWTLFPQAALDYRKEIRITGAKRWPTPIPLDGFRKVTGEVAFPAYLASAAKDGKLNYYCNNTVEYTLRGIPVKLDVKWDFELPPGGNDTELAVYRGTLASVEVHQKKEQKFIPELYVVPVDAARKQAVGEALRRRVAALVAQWPGIEVRDEGSRFHVLIPDKHRIGHEAHFALLTKRFFEYVQQPKSLPAWEDAFMLAKYYVTTEGVALARRNSQ
jgi:predicted dehydrogenase